MALSGFFLDSYQMSPLYLRCLSIYVMLHEIHTYFLWPYLKNGVTPHNMPCCNSPALFGRTICTETLSSVDVLATLTLKTFLNNFLYIQTYIFLIKSEKI